MTTDDEDRSLPTVRLGNLPIEQNSGVVKTKVRGFFARARYHDLVRTLEADEALKNAQTSNAKATVLNLEAQQELAEALARAQTYSHPDEVKKAEAEHQKKLAEAEHQDKLDKIKREEELADAEHKAKLADRQREEELNGPEPKQHLSPEEQQARREAREEAKEKAERDRIGTVLETGAMGLYSQLARQEIDKWLMETYNHTNADADDVSEEHKDSIRQLKLEALGKDQGVG